MRRVAAYRNPSRVYAQWRSGRDGTDPYGVLVDIADIAAYGFGRWFASHVIMALWAGYLFLFLYAFWVARFLPSPDHVARVIAVRSELTAGIGTIFAVLSFFVLMQPSTRLPGLRVVARAGLATLFGASGFLAPAVLQTALPALYSYVAAAPTASLTVEVVERGLREGEPRCERRATVVWPDAAGQRKTVCGVPPAIWDELKPGHSLVLTGPRTVYGLRYDTIALAHPG